MKFKPQFILIAIILGGFCMGNIEPAHADSFTITSNSFKDGGVLPNAQIYNHFGCTGKNISPHLKWQGAPKNTKSFAIIAHDPDAPRPEGWYHWIVLNIPADISSLKEGQQINHPMMQIKNDFGGIKYGGACPPKGHGLHHYNFTIYALDIVALLPSPGTTPQSIAKQIKNKAIGSATITAVYGRE